MTLYLTLLCLCLVLQPATSLLAAENKWTVDDLLQTERLTDFTVSPADPRIVVWVKPEANKEKNEHVSQLFRWEPGSGAEAVQLTRGKESSVSPRFSPNGRLLAFLNARTSDESKKKSEPKAQIWLLAAGEPYSLTQLDREVRAFAWRGTNRIVFSAQEAPAQREREFEKKKDTTRVIEDEANEPPARLFEVDLKTKKVTRLTSNADRIGALFVSPDGIYALTFHDQSLRFEYDNAVRPHYFLTDLRTGESKRIFSDRRFNLLAVEWMPDSRGFYAANGFTAHPKYLEITVSELWHFEIEGAKETQVPLDWERGLARGAGPVGGFLAATTDGVLAILADGVRVKPARFVRIGNGWTREFVTGALATNLSMARVTATGGSNFLHFVHSAAETPPQFFAARLNGAALEAVEQLGVLNESFKKKRKARVEVLRWRGALGEEVEGLLHYPHDHQPGQPRPLVLMIHGGPFGVDSDAWEDRPGYPIQLHCQRGAFVLRVNYHGSSGYGLKFGQSIVGETRYYDLPVEDIERGVDDLIARGLVDPERIGVLGWSNGGILTLALITRNPARYKAAASGAGGFEWVADTSITKFGQAFNDLYFGKMPWEDLENYRRNAPYYQADRIRTPLIIFHGDADTSVPIHHGWMQFRALQQRTQTPVQFVVFPGEEHGLKKISHMRRKIEEELAWFDQYLYGSPNTTEPWLKKGSPITALVARGKAKREGTRFGVIVKGRLLPEVVAFGDMNVGRFEVTRAQFSEFQASYAVAPGKENFPANAISFEQAKEYCAWLSELTGQMWRLPTEAEAEKLYEASAGTENTLDHWAGYSPNHEDAKRLLRAVDSIGPDILLREVGSFAGAGDGELVFDLGGNAGEWIVSPDGKGRLAGGSADRSKELPNREQQAGAAYSGFRVLRE